MTTYEVYLELGEAGACMAQVPALPGCIVRAASRAVARAALPAAERAYQVWLREHGENAPDPPEPITFRVAATQEGRSLFARVGRGITTRRHALKRALHAGGSPHRVSPVPHCSLLIARFPLLTLKQLEGVD